MDKKDLELNEELPETDDKNHNAAYRALKRAYFHTEQARWAMNDLNQMRTRASSLALTKLEECQMWLDRAMKEEDENE